MIFKGGGQLFRIYPFFSLLTAVRLFLVTESSSQFPSNAWQPPAESLSALMLASSPEPAPAPAPCEAGAGAR